VQIGGKTIHHMVLKWGTDMGHTNFTGKNKNERRVHRSKSREFGGVKDNILDNLVGEGQLMNDANTHTKNKMRTLTWKDL